MAKAAFNKKGSFHQQTRLKFREEITSAIFGALLYILLKLGHLGKYMRNTCESYEMWCRRRMEKISWTDRVKKIRYCVEKEPPSYG
jgi:hypothetical protein